MDSQVAFIVESLVISLINDFGYLGVFLVSFVSSATIIFPLPGFAAIPLAAAVLNPFLVGVAGGLGAALGEMVGYGVGLGSRKLTQKKKKEIDAWFARFHDAFKKYNGALVIFLFSVTPLPFDIMGLFCGAIKYDIKKFFVATLAGKILRFIILAYAAAGGIAIINDYF